MSPQVLVTGAGGYIGATVVYTSGIGVLAGSPAAGTVPRGLHPLSGRAAGVAL